MKSETIYLNPQGPESPGSWWARYSSNLTGLTVTARSSIDVDSSYIVDRGIFPDGTTDQDVGQVRTGLVLGSVQSGKTASMFAVTAKAIDQGIDVVVILAGTRLSLWEQTHSRFISQVDCSPDDSKAQGSRTVVPSPHAFDTSSNLSLSDTYRLPAAVARRRLRTNTPVIFIAMKEVNHLHAVGGALRESLFKAAEGLNRPVKMLVIDDEVDDGSVLDTIVESGLDPLSSALKQIPRAVADLWDPRSGSPPKNLRTTYLGYTATPQANLLQENHNPLAPRDFIVSLRTPLGVGRPVNVDNLDVERSITYPEPAGLDHYYIGGEMFYHHAVSRYLSQPVDVDHEDTVGDAVIHFMIAAAIRYIRSGKPNGPHTARGLGFESKEDVRANVCDATSMLYHPSAEIDSHFLGAMDVLRWAGIDDDEQLEPMVRAGEISLPATKLKNRLFAEEHKWIAVHDSYSVSCDSVNTELDLRVERVIPAWSDVRDALIGEVFPGTRISIVNSDPDANDRPEFDPVWKSDSGKWSAGRDICTIFVSGNVMSRGLTLEGLVTSLFLRSSANPLADTQMQMQRWFGYRGSYVELCRLFCTVRQLELFRSYHSIDVAIRMEILKNMGTEAPRPRVLHGLEFSATGKIANLARTPLCPNPRPFIKFVNNGLKLDPNLVVVGDVFSNSDVHEVRASGALRGYMLDRTYSLGEAADLLNQMTYEQYSPDGDSPVGKLWSTVQDRVNGVAPLDRKSLPFYNPPAHGGERIAESRFDCPYAVAAYLRFWESCLTRPVPGIFENGHAGRNWSFVDLSKKSALQPRFRIGVRFGIGSPLNQEEASLFPFAVSTTSKRVGAAGELETTWGANDPDAGPGEFRGDEFFDLYYGGADVPQTGFPDGWRPEGFDGQILFYINKVTGADYAAVGIGVCIPRGGPEQFSATRV